MNSLKLIIDSTPKKGSALDDFEPPFL